MATENRSDLVRMDELATLPVFFKLRGKRAVLAGGSAPAVWKADLLAAAGARVEVYARDPVPDMTELAAMPDRAVSIVRRDWTAKDLPGAAIAIGAIDTDEEAEAFRSAAKDAGVPVNVVDRPSFCDFQFGTVVARTPLVIGIGTDGAAPVLGQAIRARIEAILPRSLRLWAEAARNWRPALQARELDFRSRRRFWEIFAGRALDTGDRSPTDADREACFAAVADGPAAQSGRITLVGCGATPGSLTLDAVAALQSADVIGYDPDVTLDIVGFARREATKIPLPRDRYLAFPLIADACAAGQHVAWLGRGDPRADQVWRERRAALATNAADVQLVAGIAAVGMHSERP